jgi:hypothetical protein
MPVIITLSSSGAADQAVALFPSSNLIHSIEYVCPVTKVEP